MPPSDDQGLRRLNGWKEIAAHLGKGVRTAQRWEKEAGLPIRRVGGPGSESVYALADELDRWSLGASAATASPEATPTGSAGDPGVEGNPARQEPARSGSGRGVRRAAMLLTLALAAAGLTALVSRALPDSSASDEPASVTVDHGALSVLDANGGRLALHPFEPPLAACASATPEAGEANPVQGTIVSASLLSCPDRVLVADVTDDGRRDVLVARGAGRLYVLESGAAPGPPFEVTRQVEYIERRHNQQPLASPRRMTYGPSFNMPLVFVARTRPGETRVWIVGTHHVNYPSVLAQLRVGRGGAAVVSEYWSPGFITSVAIGEPGNAQRVLVGAVHNETGGASLAVFRAASPAGSAPTLTGDKECLNCPAGTPDAFFIFPRSPIVEQQGLPSGVNAIAWLPGHGFHTVVKAGWVAARLELPPAFNHYTFDSGLRIRHAEVGPSYLPLQRQLEAAGLVDARSRQWTDEDLFPVLRWTKESGTFDEITGPAR